MRMTSLLLVLLLGPMLVAEEPQQGAAGAPGQVVKKPVLDPKSAEAPSAEPAADAKSADAKEDQAEEAGEQAGDAKDDAKAEKPLHEHPTLLKMLARNNQLRQNRGLRPHRINPALTKAAQDHAAYMARTRVFSHYSNGGPGGRAVKHGFSAGVLENIGYGYGNVDSAFNGWFYSGGHFANMMSNTTDAGFGFALSPDGTPYWVAVYGTAPKGQEPKPETPKAEVQAAGATEPVKESAGDASKADGDSKNGKERRDEQVKPASEAAAPK